MKPVAISPFAGFVSRNPVTLRSAKKYPSLVCDCREYSRGASGDNVGKFTTRQLHNLELICWMQISKRPAKGHHSAMEDCTATGQQTSNLHLLWSQS